MSSPAPQYRPRMTHLAPRLREAAAERVRLRVVPLRRTQAARVPFVTLVTLIMLGGVVGLLLFNTSMQQASFASTSLEEQAASLTAREQTLKMELDELRDPQRVALRAQRLGMVRTTSPAFLDLRTGKILGDAKAAGPQDGLRVRPYPADTPAELKPEVKVVTVPAKVDQNPQNQSGEQSGEQGGRNQGSDTGAASPNAGAAAGRNG